MRIKDTCLWSKTAPKHLQQPRLQEDVYTEVCIIGAGYTGLSSAIHLAEKNISSVVLEANKIGHGGSGRNVGYINAGVWMKPSDVEQELGAVAGKKLNERLGDAPQLVFGLIDRYGIDAQETRTGNFQLAHNKKTEANIRERHKQWKERGADVTLFTNKQCKELIGTDKVRLAMLDNRSGTLNPQAYAHGLAKTAIDLGVSLYEKTRVTELRKIIQAGKTQWQVVTPTGNVIADKVILATNAYTEGEWTNIQKTLFLVNYYQIASEPLTCEASRAILHNKQGAADTRTVLSSIRRDKDNRFLLGTVGSHVGKPAGFMQMWADRVTEYYFPQLGKLNWQYHWSGQFGFTDDHLMRVFEPADGLLTATAFNGRGITTGTLFGKAFADYIVSGNSDDLPLPLTSLEQNIQKFTDSKSLLYETGVTLYHMGQCLRVII